jgi:VCBS repeat-containing protein
LKAKYGNKFGEIPLESIGVYTYLSDRVGVGLKQLMAGNRKWNLNLLTCGDLMSLSTIATQVTGIALAHEVENDAVKKILDY